MTKNEVETLLDLLQVGENRTAVVVPELGLSVTYRSLRQQVLDMAGQLAAAGIGCGDRVAIALPNGLPAIVTFLAASIAGTAAPLNPSYPYEEYLFFLEDTSARVVICPAVGAEDVRGAAGERKIPTFLVELKADGTVHLLDTPTAASARVPRTDDIALVLHTSGSTGRPKRVPLSHRNLVASARNIASTYRLSPEDVSLCIMPLFHIHGIVASVLATMLSGGTVVVPTKFSPLVFWRTVGEHRVTWYSGVPTMHQLLLARMHGHTPPETRTLRFIRSCSAPLTVEVIGKLESAFRVPFVEAYGMTEAAHQMSANPIPPGPCKHGSVGLPTGIQLSIMDDSGKHLGANARGEVVIQGPSVFRGYEDNPEANRRCFVEGWFRTGDQGFLDEDGYLHLTGRIKDLIIRGGEKISPREVDELLLRHPAVAEAVTFSFPHPTLGEEVAAAVVLHQPKGVTEAALAKFCREHIVEFKCPKKIYIVDNIPTTATGKVRRRAVANALWGER